MGFTGFSWVLFLSCWVVLGFNGFYWVILGFIGFYSVFLAFLLGFTGFYCFSTGLKRVSTGSNVLFNRVFHEFYSVILPAITGCLALVFRLSTSTEPRRISVPFGG